MPRVQDLKIKIFADGADLNGILEMHKSAYWRVYNESNLNAQSWCE